MTVHPSVMAIDVATVCVAWKDGDYVKATAYTFKSGIGVYAVMYANKIVLDLAKAGSKFNALKMSSVGVIACGSIEVGYSLHKTLNTDDDFEKKKYLDRCFASVMDTAFLAVPWYGTVISLTWSGVILAASLIVPDDLAIRVCSSPGSAIIFLLAVFFGSTIPSAVADTAYAIAADFMTEQANIRNDRGIPTIVILPAGRE